MKRLSSRKEQGRTTKPRKQETCKNCSKTIARADRALFVEEDLARVFCSEECITDFFAPEIDKLEKQYWRRLEPYTHQELGDSEREKLTDLRWIVLQEPDEVWRQKTKEGENRYTLISKFEPAGTPVWCICICLYLRGEPSFLYIAFATGVPQLVEQYRKGSRVKVKPTQAKSTAISADANESEEASPETARVDGLAGEWTPGESLRAQWAAERRADDIPVEQFESYQSSLEETLQKPDEVWGLDVSGEHLFHFIKRFSGADGFWYVVVARDQEEDGEATPSDEAHLELLEAFPTVDPHLVDQYRKGEQQMGEPQAVAANARLIH